MRKRTAILFLLLTLLAACAKAVETPAAPTATAIPPAPTATATPGTPLVILVLPADMPQKESDQYQTAVYELAQANGMRYQLLNTLTETDLALAGPDLRIVIVLSSDPGLAALTAAAPNAQFLAVGIPGLAAAPNLSTVGAQGAPVDQQAFLAGYIAALTADDYRLGILTTKDSAGQAIETAFANGMRFYCGLCQKAFWTGWDYFPVEIPSGETTSHYPAYGDAFWQYNVSVVFVDPNVATLDLLDSMAQRGLLLISEEMPLPDLQENWVVSIKPELLPAIQRIFPDLLAGRGGQTVPVPLTLTDINADLLSEGKLRLVQETLDDLQAGYIGTGVNP